MSNTESIAIKPARYGRGVFAVRRLPAEDSVGEVVGEIIEDAEYSSDYCIDLGNGAVMEAEEPFRLLNHSCDPNCELVMWGYRRRNGRRYHRLWVQTLRPIARGEQLTIDYAWPASAAIPCGCGSPQCRGWIVSSDELQELTGTSLPAAS